MAVLTISYNHATIALLISFISINVKIIFWFLSNIQSAKESLNVDVETLWPKMIIKRDWLFFSGKRFLFLSDSVLLTICCFETSKSSLQKIKEKNVRLASTKGDKSSCFRSKLDTLFFSNISLKKNNKRTCPFPPNENICFYSRCYG